LSILGGGLPLIPFKSIVSTLFHCSLLVILEHFGPSEGSA